MKSVALVITSLLAVAFFIYSHLLRLKIESVTKGFNDCYELIDFYEDSLTHQQSKYESIIKELRQMK
jgi:hypothetical protein